MEELELTILIPALNEEKANNGSTDKTKEIAIKNGARVIDVPEKGYGNALISGIKEAKRKIYYYGRRR